MSDVSLVSYLFLIFMFSMTFYLLKTQDDKIMEFTSKYGQVCN